MSNFAQCPPSQSGEGNHTTFSNPNVPLQTREYALAGISGMLRSLAGAQGAFTSRGAKPKGLNLMLLGLTTKQTKQTTTSTIHTTPSVRRMNFSSRRSCRWYLTHTLMRHSFHHHLPCVITSCVMMLTVSCVCVCRRRDVHHCVRVDLHRHMRVTRYVPSQLCAYALLCVFVCVCVRVCGRSERVVPLVTRRPSARTSSCANRQVQTLGTSCTSNAGLKGSQQLFGGVSCRSTAMVWAAVSNTPPFYQVQAATQH